MNHMKSVLAVSAALLLAACAPKPAPICNWGDYQSSLYRYYKNTSAPEKEIETLNKVIQEAQGKNKPVAPVCFMPIAATPIWLFSSSPPKKRHFLNPLPVWIF